MRIAFVINSLGAGGAERNLAALANHCVNAGHRVAIITFQSSSHVPFYSLSAAIERIDLDCSTKALGILGKIIAIPRILSRLRNALKRFKPSATVAFMDQANILTLIASAGLSVPVLISERLIPSRTSLLELSGPLRGAVTALRNSLYARATRIVCQTERAKRLFPSPLQSQIVVIPNALEVLVEENPTIKLPRPCIVGMGRMTAQKRFDRLIRAFTTASQRVPGWHLVLIGDGEDKKALITQAQQTRVSEQIHFFRATSTPFSALRQADIFALSSQYEGFPNVLLEAMACGAACVATDCPAGPAEIIADSKNGLLVANADGDELSSTLIRLMSDEVLRAQLGHQAQSVTERFSPAMIYSQWEDVLDTALRGAKS